MKPAHALLVLLVGLSGCTGARAQPQRSANRFEALDAIVRDGTLFLVDADGTTLRAVSLGDGAVRFTAPLGPRAPAALIHDLGAGRLLVQTSHRFVTVDQASGAVLAARDTTPGFSFVWRSGGACALRSECTFEPIDCRTGRPLGPKLRGRTMHRYALSEESARHGDVSCDARFDVLGRAGDLSLFHAGPLDSPIETTSGEVIAIRDTGEIAYHRADIGCDACATHGMGAARDGSVCFTSDAEDERTITLAAFACTTGNVLFRTRAPRARPYRAPEVLVGSIAGRGLFVMEPMRARLLSTQGRELFSREVTPGVLLLPEGVRFASYPLTLEGFSELLHVDAAHGRALRSEPTSGRGVRIAEDGTVGLAAPLYAAERGGGPMNALHRFTFVRAPGGSSASLGDRTVLRTAGDAWPLGEHVRESVAVLVVAEPRRGHPDLVHVVRAP